MRTLTNAAQEFIAETIARIRANPFRDYSEEDLASALREQQAIESEIGQLAALLAAAREIAKMKHPSVTRLLRRQGFNFEADRVAELVAAIDAIPEHGAQKDGD